MRRDRLSRDMIPLKSLITTRSVVGPEQIERFNGFVAARVLGSADRRDLRLAITHAARSSVRAVDLMYNLGGGTSVYKTSPLQRIFRDVHVASQHMQVATPTMETAGRHMLGLDGDYSQL